MAYTLPPLELDGLPMHLDRDGRTVFTLGITIDADGEWQITSIHMGEQELKGETYRRFAQHFEAEHTQTIHDHASENFADAVEGAHFSYDKTAPRTLAFELGAA